MIRINQISVGGIEKDMPNPRPWISVHEVAICRVREAMTLKI